MVDLASRGDVLTDCLTTSVDCAAQDEAACERDREDGGGSGLGSGNCQLLKAS